MSSKKKAASQVDGGKVGINIWCEPALVERLDARLRELVDGVDPVCWTKKRAS